MFVCYCGENTTFWKYKHFFDNTRLIYIIAWWFKCWTRGVFFNWHVKWNTLFTSKKKKSCSYDIDLSPKSFLFFFLTWCDYLFLTMLFFCYTASHLLFEQSFVFWIFLCYAKNSWNSTQKKKFHFKKNVFIFFIFFLDCS